MNKELVPKVQKPGAPWMDETGISIPFNRISPLEKMKEQLSGKILMSAMKINGSLMTFKNDLDKAMQNIHQQLVDDKKLSKKNKGNFTWYNFNKSIKVEVAVNETIQFDEALISAAQDNLDYFISKNVQGTDELVRELINSAFHNSTGGLDTKKVLSLMRYRGKVKHEKFQKALDLIAQSITRPSSKKYFRIWAKDANGKYQNIDLNFSSI